MGLLLVSLSAMAQPQREVDQVLFDDILTGRGGQRRVELYVRALTRFGDPVQGLTASDFKIRDSGEDVAPSEILVQSLAETGVGMTCVIAIDLSRTMRGESFDRARSAALDFIRALEARDRVAIVTFSDVVNVLVDFDASPSEAISQIELLEVDDLSLTTALYDGLHKAISLIRLGKNLPRRSFVIVFSDGKDAGSLRTLDQVTEFGRGSQFQPPVAIFAIGYSRFGGDGLPILEKLARDTGGDFVRAKDPREISAFFDATRRHMRESLVVSYEGDLDGNEHEIDVTVQGVTATRSATYEDISPPLTPWLLGAAGIVLLATILVILARSRRNGRLLFRNGPLSGQAIALKGSRTRIGALPDNEVVLQSENVSRYHASIIGRGRNLKIQDLDSSNGTFLNENRISSSPLEPGDRIRFADVEAIFER